MSAHLEYIRANHKEQTDGEMAAALKLDRSRVQAIRAKAGLPAKRGRRPRQTSCPCCGALAGRWAHPLRLDALAKP